MTKTLIFIIQPESVVYFLSLEYIVLLVVISHLLILPMFWCKLLIRQYKANSLVHYTRKYYVVSWYCIYFNFYIYVIREFETKTEKVSVTVRYIFVAYYPFLIYSSVSVLRILSISNI